MHFPDDLLVLQQDWLRAYAELARTPATAGGTAARRRLIALSGRLYGHPCWVRAGGADLRRAARACVPAGREEAA